MGDHLMVGPRRFVRIALRRLSKMAMCEAFQRFAAEDRLAWVGCVLRKQFLARHLLTPTNFQPALHAKNQLQTSIVLL